MKRNPQFVSYYLIPLLAASVWLVATPVVAQGSGGPYSYAPQAYGAPSQRDSTLAAPPSPPGNGTWYPQTNNRPIPGSMPSSAGHGLASGSAPAPAPPASQFQQTGHSAGPATNAIESTLLVGIVGNQHILAGDLLPTIEQMLEPYVQQLEKEPDPQRREMMHKALNQQRWMFMERMLTGVIENKLLYHEFLRKLPDDKRDQAMVKIRKQLSQEYDEKELPPLLERAKLESAAELDAKLRQYGASLSKQKQTFMERTLGRAAVGQSINTNPEITHTAMLEYYREHEGDYQVPAKARWEQMSTLFEKFSNKRQAWEAIARMGDEVYLGGAPFAAVAKRQSQGSNAENGGYYDWTARGSLRSKTVDAAVFSLPLNQLSPIIEDDRGFHIIRVLERTDAGMISFEDAQPEIKEKLKQEKMKVAIQDFLDKVRKDVYVWTIFEEQKQAVSTAERQGPLPPAGSSGR